MNSRETFTLRGLGFRIAGGVAGLAAASCVRPLESGQDYPNEDVYFAFHQLDTRREVNKKRPVNVEQTRFVTLGGDFHMYSLLANGSVHQATFLKVGQRPGAFSKFREIAASPPTLVNPGFLEVTEAGNVIVAGGDRFNRFSTTPFLAWNKQDGLWQKISLGSVREVSQVLKLGDIGKYLVVGHTSGNEGQLFVVSNLDDPRTTRVAQLKGEKSLSGKIAVLGVDAEKQEVRILAPRLVGMDLITFDYETGYPKERITRFPQLIGDSLIVTYRVSSKDHAAVVNRQNIHDFDMDYPFSSTSFSYQSLFNGGLGIIEDLVVFEKDKKQHVWFGGSFLNQDRRLAPFVAFGEVGKDIAKDWSVKVYDLSPFERAGSVKKGSLQQVKMYDTLLASFIINGCGNVLVPLENGNPRISQAIFPNRGFIK